MADVRGRWRLRLYCRPRCSLRRRLLAAVIPARRAAAWTRAGDPSLMRQESPGSSAPILRLADIRKRYNIGTPVEEVLHGIDRLCSRRSSWHQGTVGLRKEHAAQHHRPARAAELGIARTGGPADGIAR